MLSIIVAKAKNNIIGKDNTMLWKLPDDLKRFKENLNNLLKFYKYRKQCLEDRK